MKKRSRKQKTVRELADNIIFKFGSAPGSREWDYMRWAYIRGYNTAKRRLIRRRRKKT